MRKSEHTRHTLSMILAFWILLSAFHVLAQESTESAQQSSGADASDPLAKVGNTDLRWTYLDESGASTNLWWIKGGYSWANIKWLKLNYELTYARTDDDGTITHGFDVLSLKPLFFIGKGEIGSWKYGLATGFELVLDFAEVETGVGTIRGYGTGSDLISPLFGISLTKGKTTLVPLVQHYLELSGPDVNTTGFRLIAIQKFWEVWWTKLDLIVPYDWDNDLVPGTVEVEVGRMISPAFGIYGSGLAGFADSSLDWGFSANVRFVY